MTPKAARQFLAILPPDSPETRELERARGIVAKSPPLQAAYESQLTLDTAARSALVNLEIPEPLAGELSTLAVEATVQRSKRRFNPRDPAMISVTIGFLLLVAVLTWHFLGRVGVFPEEALTIAAEGVRLRNDQFEVVDEKAGALEDWFVLKGFDRFHIPEKFAGHQAAGARIFKIENQPVAVLAIPENFMFFLIFDPVPFGITIPPGGGWQITEFDYKYAAAICEEKGMGFMIVIKGTPQDLARIVGKSR